MRSSVRTHHELALENLALRQQVAVLTRSLGKRRLRLGPWDRAFWVVLSSGWTSWREALAIVQPATVVRWHRDAFRRFWTRRSQARRPGRPGLDREVVSLIRRMAQANVTWGAPRIRNELAKLGIEVAVSSVAKYMPRRRKPIFADVARIPGQPPEGLGSARLLRGAHRDVRRSVWACRTGPPSQARAALQRNGKADCRMDSQAGDRGLPRGDGATVRVAGPGQDLR